MIKKIALLVLAVFVLSCGSSKPAYKKSKHTTSRSVKKPKPVASRTSNKSTQIRTIEDKYKGAKTGTSGNKEIYDKSEILQATSRVKVTTEIVHEYISTYREIAKNNMRMYGIPASITLAQGILESGSGTAPLSAIANNHFGIKCHKEWTGPSVRWDDDEAQECFRRYEHASESYRDHSEFLTTRSRYSSLFELDRDDYKGWARGLRKAGYATDPKYPEKLIGIIDRYQLNQYDAEVLGTPFKVSSTRDAVVDSDTYQVSKGDTLYSISKKFNLSVDELRRKNNITENTISIGQHLRIR